jgi:hypothetical protein
MSGDADRNMEQEFDRLARVTRAWFGAQGRRAQAPAWLVLERAMRGRQRRIQRAKVSGGLALGAVAVALVMAVSGVLQPEAALTYRLSSGAAAGSGAGAGVGIIQASDGQTASLSFSDGSDVLLQPGARARVLATTARGANVQLDAGRARFSIRHLPRAEWAVSAGPFTVVVHGTVFDVGWSAAGQELQVGLVTGAVTVHGPVAGGAVAVRPGQRLTARASTGQTRIDRLADLGVAPAAPSPAAVSPMPPPVEPRVDDRAAPAPSLPTPSLPMDPAAPAQTAPTKSPALAVRAVSASWAARVASGAFLGVVADAQMLGLSRCLSLAPAASLAALADAARYARRPELARRALLAERRRFAGSTGAHDAAFLLGRLAEDATGDHREALRWYDLYLDEGGAGQTATYGAEALGRRMLALERLGRGAEARAAAARYLQSFPDGPHAHRAERLTRR